MDTQYKPKFCKDLTYERINDLLDFLHLTRKRRADLEQKKITIGLSRAEEYELAMCIHDAKNAERILNA